MTPKQQYYIGRIRYVSLLIFSIMLGACSNYSTKENNGVDSSKETYLEIPDIWAIHAKLGIRNSEDSGSVTLNWRQVDNHYTIQVSGPFGQGNAKISGDGQLISIEQPGKDTLYSRNPKRLVQQTFGWDLPLEHLPYWIRGRQNPNDNNTIQNKQYNEMGLLSGFSQFGWTLEYSRYEPQQRRLAPHKIRAKNNDITLTLIIKEWDFPALTTQ